MSEVSAAAEGSNLLSTIAPGTPTPLRSRLSSVMVFSRKETSGIPQKSVILACSSTTVARFSAASPVVSLKPTLHHQGTQQCYEKLIEVLGSDQAGDIRDWAATECSLSCQRALTQKRTLWSRFE